ncbi:MAG: esterase-like activity of phytase family protein [Acidobacteria bacterium]|nr:esterase-like activity of phytase family protein [Acidobacteriota bacterium]
MLVTAVVTGAIAGCAPAVSRPPAAAQPTPVPTLEFLAAHVIPSVRPDSVADRARLFGSVSGLARDARTGRYLAVIDDRQPARVAWLDVSFAGGALAVTPLSVMAIVPGPGMDERRVTGADLEGVAALPDGTFVATEEGHRSTGAPGQPPAGEWPVALLSLSPQMVVTGMHEWPPSFDLGPDRGGIRDNQGAEALTRTPDGRLIAGLEQPRHADLPATRRNGRPFGGGRGGPGRLVEFVADGKAWRARRQWVFPIAPTPVREGFDAICDDGENGLTELLALDDWNLLALERACLVSPATRVVRNTALISHVSLQGAEDVSAVESLAGGRWRGATKTLILDVDSLIPHLPPSLANLDNFEAMAFGPELPDGSRTLLVVSDDNFRATQQTVFLLFRIRGQGSGSRDQGSGSRDQGSGIREQGAGGRDQGSGTRDQGPGDQGPGSREQGVTPPASGFLPPDP